MLYICNRNRTDAETEFNETFIDTSDIDELW